MERAPQQTRHRRAIQANYDRLSRWYDWLADPGERNLRDKGLEKLQVRAGETVLEIGFGTGQALLALAQAVGETGKVVGVDLSPQMAAVARQRLSTAGLVDRVHLVCADAVQILWEKDSFDAIFFCFSLEILDPQEMQRILANCRQALRSTGRVCVVAMSGERHKGFMARLYRWSAQTFPAWVDCRPIFPSLLLTQAGFEMIESTSASLWGLPVSLVLARK
jgi:demethylmenaquinone methyltransferase/2-methoxy-6-polyprenyl-1,4-benzoquinol methylase